MGDRRDGFVKAIITGLLANEYVRPVRKELQDHYVDVAWQLADKMVDRDPDEHILTEAELSEIQEVGVDNWTTKATTPPLQELTPGELAYIEEMIEIEEPKPKPPTEETGFEVTYPVVEEPEIPIPSDAMSGDFRDLDAVSYAVFDEDSLILMDSMSDTQKESVELAVEITGLLWAGLVKFGFSVKEIEIDVYEMST